MRDNRTNLQKGDVRLFVDGREIRRFDYGAGRDFLRYVPSRQMSYGGTG